MHTQTASMMWGGVSPTLGTGHAMSEVKVLIRGGMQEHQNWQDNAAPCLTEAMGMGGGHVPIIQPCLTPGREEKRQNGRRFNENGEPMFTLTAQDQHGVLIKNATQDGYQEAKPGDGINLSYPDSETRRGRVQESSSSSLMCNDSQGTLTDDLRIRKLTPKECFRLQGWTDDYFEKAAFVNSDSQLYRQAGNGVTVNVIYEIARRFPDDTILPSDE